MTPVRKMNLNLNELIKSSSKESVNFTKKNVMKYGIIGDLHAARDACKTKEARTMIEALIVPLQKDLQKEVAAFEKKMAGIWKKAKGEKIPKETQKELDTVLKKSADQIKSKNGLKPSFNDLFITSYSISG